MENTGAHQFTFHSIDGGEIPLSDYAGKAILIVNTASQCGFTPQYQGLEALWQDWKDRDLIVLGVPSNSFDQEAGNDGEIREFCDLKFHVTFPMTGKTPVIGRMRIRFTNGSRSKLASSAGRIGTSINT